MVLFVLYDPLANTGVSETSYPIIAYCLAHYFENLLILTPNYNHINVKQERHVE